MTNPEYKRMTLADMQKKRWRIARDIQNRLMTIPAGSIVSISNKRGGLDIVGPKCGCCGVQIHCRKIRPCDIEEIVSDPGKPERRIPLARTDKIIFVPAHPDDQVPYCKKELPLDD